MSHVLSASWRCRLSSAIPRRQLKLAATMQPSEARAAPKVQTLTCRRCHQQFTREENHKEACRYHTAIYTGGEISKAIGFCRASSAPEDQLAAVVGRTGLIRFWDCCGAEDSNAPGCCTGFHLSYDDPDDS